MKSERLNIYTPNVIEQNGVSFAKKDLSRIRKICKTIRYYRQIAQQVFQRASPHVFLVHI